MRDKISVGTVSVELADCIISENQATGLIVKLLTLTAFSVDSHFCSSWQNRNVFPSNLPGKVNFSKSDSCRHVSKSSG